MWVLLGWYRLWCLCFIIASRMFFWILMFMISFCSAIILLTLFIKVDWKSFNVALTFFEIDSWRIFLSSIDVVSFLLLSSISIANLSLYPVYVGWVKSAVALVTTDWLSYCVVHFRDNDSLRSFLESLWFVNNFVVGR